MHSSKLALHLWHRRACSIARIIESVAVCECFEVAECSTWLERTLNKLLQLFQCFFVHVPWRPWSTNFDYKFCLQGLSPVFYLWSFWFAFSIRTEVPPTKEPSIGSHKPLPTSQDVLDNMLLACAHHDKLWRQCNVHRGETLRRLQASTFPRAFAKQRLYNYRLLSITPSHLSHSRSLDESFGSRVHYW